MTEERLQLLPEEFLRNIAQKEGIHISNNIDKQELIDLIIEAIEEDRDENRLLDNPVMQIKEKKFDITLNEQYYFDDDKYPLPEKYHKTKIVLLLKDPSWAFAYWEVKDADITKYCKNKDECKMFLRVYELFSLNVTNESFKDYQDVPISYTDQSWYITLPHPGKYYCIDLFLEEEGLEQKLCRSNFIESPLWEISNNKDYKDFKGLGNDPMIVASVYDLGPSEIEGKISQRIISMIDSEYLE